MVKARSSLPVEIGLNPLTLITLAALLASLLSGVLPYNVLADAPAEGVVVEGVSVPGIELGYTRAQVEAAYGAPRWCQDDEVGGDQAVCSYPIEGGGSALVRYLGADGRYARNTPDDTAFQAGWSTPGWTTTAGVNTTLALDDRQAVVDAYPNAEVTYDERGTITRVEDSQLGILIRWIRSGYIFPDSVIMDIYTPAARLAAGSSLHVPDISLSFEKIKSRRHVIVMVSVQGEHGQPVYGAEVFSTWTYPGGAVQTVNDATSPAGYAFFELYDARNGSWTLTIDDVLLEGHPFDREDGVVTISFDAHRLK